ncbi:hypothetical protein IEQ34_002316 [Dendrobium chrysotoxum]|uniref:Uncharacterized protein n=1 Tax=Dendrobium chrysotoxum TaxID=161865 RepID=A0AAV7HMU6_DENCH|nr:hypothetical protein IEQ34_002316 [Dendrobium chrysotoxum]
MNTLEAIAGYSGRQFVRLRNPLKLSGGVKAESLEGVLDLGGGDVAVAVSIEGREEEGSSVEGREIAILERDQAKEEAERLRSVVRRQRRELKSRMLDVAREESERKRMHDERSSAWYIEFYDAMYMPLAIALSGQQVLG